MAVKPWLSSGLGSTDSKAFMTPAVLDTQWICHFQTGHGASLRAFFPLHDMLLHKACTAGDVLSAPSVACVMGLHMGHTHAPWWILKLETGYWFNSLHIMTDAMTDGQTVCCLLQCCGCPLPCATGQQHCSLLVCPQRPPELCLHGNLAIHVSLCGCRQPSLPLLHYILHGYECGRATVPVQDTVVWMATTCQLMQILHFSKQWLILLKLKIVFPKNYYFAIPVNCSPHLQDGWGDGVVFTLGNLSTCLSLR